MEKISEFKFLSKNPLYPYYGKSIINMTSIKGKRVMMPYGYFYRILEMCVEFNSGIGPRERRFGWGVVVILEINKSNGNYIFKYSIDMPLRFGNSIYLFETSIPDRMYRYISESII